MQDAESHGNAYNGVLLEVNGCSAGEPRLEIVATSSS